MFIVVDGIAGSGKSTIIKSIRDRLKKDGQRIFDLGDWCKKHDDLPTFEEVQEADAFFTFEPTKVWVGSAIRQEMSFADGRAYTGTELAHAFALDRLLLYRRLIIPALAAGKTVIQDRSASSSFVYQPIMEDGPSLEEILELPGNALALEHAPQHLILTDIPPEMAVERTKGRADESKGVFEQLELLKQTHERFRSDWFRKLYEDRGTNIHFLDTSSSMENSLTNTNELISTLLT